MDFGDNDRSSIVTDVRSTGEIRGRLGFQFRRTQLVLDVLISFSISRRPSARAFFGVSNELADVWMGIPFPIIAQRRRPA